MLFNPFKHVIGLDIGDAAIKAVRLESRHSYSFKTKTALSALGETRLPDGALRDGEILKPEEVLRAVKQTINIVSNPYAVPWVVSALPETKTFAKLISSRLNPSENSAHALGELIKNEMPVPLDESYIDWQIAENTEKQGQETESKIIVGAALKKTADAYTYLLNIAGLTPLALEVEALSIARALLPQTTNGVRLVLDIGETNTICILTDRGVVQFTLLFHFSGRIMTERIQQALSCTFDEAERVKITCGMDYEHCLCHRQGKTEQCAIKPAMDKTMDELVGHINNALAFYSEHFHGSAPIDSVILSGGAGAMIALDHALSKQINLPVERCNPLAYIQTDRTLKNSPEFTRAIPRFTTAIGLGLRGITSCFE